jgi:hypothetical protein
MFRPTEGEFAGIAANLASSHITHLHPPALVLRELTSVVVFVFAFVTESAHKEREIEIERRAGGTASSASSIIQRHKQLSNDLDPLSLHTRLSNTPLLSWISKRCRPRLPPIIA